MIINLRPIKRESRRLRTWNKRSGVYGAHRIISVRTAKRDIVILVRGRLPLIVPGYYVTSE